MGDGGVGCCVGGSVGADAVGGIGDARGGAGSEALEGGELLLRGLLGLAESELAGLTRQPVWAHAVVHLAHAMHRHHYTEAPPLPPPLPVPDKAMRKALHRVISRPPLVEVIECKTVHGVPTSHAGVAAAVTTLDVCVRTARQCEKRRVA